MSNNVLWPVPSNRGPQKRPGSSRVVAGLVTTVAIVTAQATGFVHVRGTADASIVSVSTPQLQPLKAERVEQGRKDAKSRIVTTSAVVTAQATGFIRIRGTADASVISVSLPQLRPVQGRIPNGVRPSVTSRIFDFQEQAVVPVVSAAAQGRVRVRSAAAALVAVQAAAQGRVRVRSTADGSIVTVVVPQLRPIQGRTPNTTKRSDRSSRIFDYESQAVAAVVTAQATGRVRIRGTADGTSFEAEQLLIVVVGRPKIYDPAPTLKSRFFEYEAQVSAPTVTAAAVGRIRVRGTADGTSFVPTVTVSLRPLKNKGTSQRRRAAASRMISGLETGLVTVVAAAAEGRIRVRSTADGSVVPEEIFLPLLALPQANQPSRARLNSRVVKIPTPDAAVVTASGIGFVRIRSTSDATAIAGITAPVTRLTARRPNTPGERVVRSRVFEYEAQVIAPVVTAQATGRVRIRGTADGTSLAADQLFSGVVVGRRQIFDPAPTIKSRHFEYEAQVVAPIVTGVAVGRVRVRGTATATSSAPTIVTAQAAGRLRLRSRAAIEGDDFNAGVVVAQNGSIWVGPVGAPAPVDAIAALDAAFLGLGFVSEQGSVLIDTPMVEAKSSWTSFYPADFVVVGRHVEIQLALIEYSKKTLQFALESTVSGAPSSWTSISNNGNARENAVVIDWVDGDFSFRLYFPKAVINEGVSSNFSRTTAAELLVHIGSTNPDMPYKIFINQT